MSDFWIQGANPTPENILSPPLEEFGATSWVVSHSWPACPPPKHKSHQKPLQNFLAAQVRQNITQFLTAFLARPVQAYNTDL